MIDVGAATHGRDSVAILARMYRPQFIWAFDPHPHLDGPSEVEGVPVVRYREAAWVESGSVSWTMDGSASRIGGKELVPCFSLANLIESVNSPIVLKIDAEGAEYRILQDLHERGVDEKITEMWVEWHPPEWGRADLEQRLRCDVKEWLY